MLERPRAEGKRVHDAQQTLEDHTREREVEEDRQRRAEAKRPCGCDSTSRVWTPKLSFGMVFDAATSQALQILHHAFTGMPLWKA